MGFIFLMIWLAWAFPLCRMIVKILAMVFPIIVQQVLLLKEFLVLAGAGMAVSGMEGVR
jgi:hypothetical protein